ncbi:MAG TPA: XdhC family protein [Chthoniobacterales bacterium]|nr:XdhC family protein [Chthoniobacterales bacterium]
MKEIRDILRSFELHRAEPLALATLVATRGSSYRRPGARMLICCDGTTAGSLSGGCLEDEVARRGLQVMRDGTPILMNFDTTLRFGCHGSIDVFVEPVRPEFLAQLAANFSERRSALALTVFTGPTHETGTRFVNREIGIPAGAFVQEIEPAIRLLVFGDGPDSTSLRTFGEILGWEVVEIDQPAELPGHADSRTAAIVKSHNYGRDFAALCHLLKLDLPYVGLLGPRRRRDQLLNAVLDEGIAVDAEVFAPAGLDLGAETPQELALALVSEIQAVFANASGESLRDRKTPIHGWNIVRRAASPAVNECAQSEP